LSYPRHVTIDQLFFEVASRSPDAIAVAQAETGTSLSYRQLAERSHGLAGALVAKGVGPESRVGLLMHRGPDMVAAMLAILETGAAYVPLDPSHPRERLAMLVDDSRVALCMTGSELAGEAAALGRPILIADDIAARADRPGLRTPASSEAPAYVMYTSGSTGRPKGVVVPHRGVTRLVFGQTYARFDSTRVFLQLAPAAFDASTFEIWGALLHGARCVLAPDQGVPDSRRLRELIVANGVTTVWLTASLFNAIVDQAPDTLATVAEVLVGGEALSVPHIRRAQALLPAVQFINGYGPTESTTFACCYRIPRPVPGDWRSIPIGPAIAHTTVHVLDAYLQPVPPGETGDLYVGGDGLAIAYLNNAALTSERFLELPGLGRLYRTGDRARVLDDGALEFQGRRDDQVKLRGYRIELGEVEAALRNTPGVSDVVATVREDTPGDRRLVAYYTLADCVAGPGPAALREALSTRLPEYMVPSAFVQLPALPLSTNGKTDRHALPAPTRARPAQGRPFSAPRTRLEAWVASLWAEVLQLDAVGVHDRFFDLGGTSISAMRFLTRLNERMRTPVPALLLFRAPTVAGLARLIELEHSDAVPADYREDQASRLTPLTSAQGTTNRHAELLERRLRRRRAN